MAIDDLLDARDKYIVQLKKDNPKISSRAAAKQTNKQFGEGRGKVSHRYVLTVWKKAGL
jgi:hypothetical protein